MLEALDAPHLGVCFDTSNWVRVGDDPVEAARRLQGRVRLVHLKDHVVPARRRHHRPVVRRAGHGRGRRARRARRAAREAEPALPVCVELGHLGFGGDEVEMVERGVSWLRAEATRREAAVAGKER